MKKGRVCTRGRAFGAVVCTRTPTQHLHLPAGAPPSRFAAPSAWLALYFAKAQWLFSERFSFLFFLSGRGFFCVPSGLFYGRTPEKTVFSASYVKEM